MSEEKYIIKIDQLPEFTIKALTPAAASRATACIIAETGHLRRLPDDEPVQIKQPDRRPWGRNLTLGAYRNDLVVHDTDAKDGPVHPASIEGE